MSEKNAIEVSGLSKSFMIGSSKKGTLLETISTRLGMLFGRKDISREEFWALRDVSFNLREGEALGIIGKNGAGKSTLLKVLSKITYPTTGRITLNGRVASLLEVGTGFHPELTGKENVFLNGTILGMTRKEVAKKFDEIVAFSGVEKFIHTPVKHYSSGMYVRLAFAVAAHLEPEILVIDEVLAVGDAEFQKKCLGKMGEVAKGGRTVLFVSHNMQAVQTLCQSSIWMNSGQIKAQGATSQVVSAYLNEFRENASEVSWTEQNAPGNESAKLMRVAVQAKDGKGTAIKAGQSVRLEFEFLNLLEGESLLDVTFHLHDELGNKIFVGSTGYMPERNYAPQGMFSATCEIPENLMMQGVYTISRLLLVQNRGSVLYEHEDAITFEIVQTGNNDFGWMGQKEGVILPKLNWKVKLNEVAEL